ncbi:hypothetical protein VTN96DRAFT_9465 [Rasamsonia emersonii]
MHLKSLTLHSCLASHSKKEVGGQRCELYFSLFIFFIFISFLFPCNFFVEDSSIFLFFFSLCLFSFFLVLLFLFYFFCCVFLLFSFDIISLPCLIIMSILSSGIRSGQVFTCIPVWEIKSSSRFYLRMPESNQSNLKQLKERVREKRSPIMRDLISVKSQKKRKENTKYRVSHATAITNNGLRGLSYRSYFYYYSVNLSPQFTHSVRRTPSIIVW